MNIISKLYELYYTIVQYNSYTLKPRDLLRPVENVSKCQHFPIYTYFAYCRQRPVNHINERYADMANNEVPTSKLARKRQSKTARPKVTVAAGIANVAASLSSVAIQQRKGVALEPSLI